MLLSLILTVALMAACYAPPEGSPTSDEPPSSALLLASSQQKLDAGDPRGAVEALISAAELAETDAERCSFAEGTTELADQMHAHEHHAQARIAYAIAIRFAKECPHLDQSELQRRQDQAAASMALVSRAPSR